MLFTITCLAEVEERNQICENGEWRDCGATAFPHPAPYPPSCGWHRSRVRVGLGGRVVEPKGRGRGGVVAVTLDRELGRKPEEMLGAVRSR